MATKKSMWVLFGILVISAWVFRSAIQAGAENANGTELKLVFKNQDGKPVTISKAELILVAWGYTDRVKLNASGSSLTIPMDASWLQFRAPKENAIPGEWPERFKDLLYVYVYLEAFGFAPIQSEKFKWLGTKYNSPKETSIKFPNTKELKIREGGRETLDIVFRKPKIRQIQFTDDNNSPFSGVKVSVSMFWSTWNHCDVLIGVKLSESQSDQMGRITVPDGDFEYALKIKSQNAIFKNPSLFGSGDIGLTRVKGKGPKQETPSDSVFSNRTILRLKDDITVVQLHRLLIKPLKMRVEHNGLPVANEMLYGCLSDCPGCSQFCCEPIEETDKNGMISIPDFCPEIYSRIFFAHIDDKAGMDPIELANSIEGAKPLWQMKPPVLPEDTLIKVDLK